MEAFVSEISLTNIQGQHQMDILLSQEGIDRDAALDYTCGIFDEEGVLLACGGCAENTLRCLAVAGKAQGMGLLNHIVTHLVQVLVARGITHIFVYTKPKNELYFTDLGFYEIARTEKVLFMENKKSGFSCFIKRLMEESVQVPGSIDGLNKPLSVASKRQIGSIVMNANPFTLGHRYLVEQATVQCILVHLFVLSEENGLIPAAVRQRLVIEGVKELSNVIVHFTGPYMISSSTFPSYFLSGDDDAAAIQAELDLQVFERIAKALAIKIRYVGEEPFSHITAIYNSVMAKYLPNMGIACKVLPRLEVAGGPVCASAVRKAIQEARLSDIKDLVPDSTWSYFNSKEAAPVINALQAGRK